LRALNRRQTETVVAALVAVGAALVGIIITEEPVLGPKFVSLQRIGRFKRPVYVTQAPATSQLFVVEKTGTVRLYDHDRLQRRPFLNIRREVKSNGKGGEQGLLSMAFAPDYRQSRLFYVAYTDHRGAVRVVEYGRSADDPLRADRHSARLVLRIPEPTTKHHGGLVLFGPDGHLYIGSGDGGPSGDPFDISQDKRSLRGKILRIDPLRGPPRKSRKGRKGRRQARPRPYTVPRDNPYVHRPGRDEIWAYGLRNPWRFSFDRPTGTIAIGDVGNERYEEIDYLPARKARGANFGWAAYEGFAAFHGGVPRGRTVLPAIAYPHGPGCAVAGGYVVRDRRLARIRGRDIVGRYLFGDYCSGKLYAFRPRPGRKPGKERSFRFQVPYLTSFGQDHSGRIYVLQEKGTSRRGKPTLGSVYRLVPRRKEVSD
jgi:glucose/arabinose dehydrogenase